MSVILVVNSGSSSLKYRLYDGTDVAADGTTERIGESGPDAGPVDHDVALRGAVVLECIDGGTQGVLERRKRAFLGVFAAGCPMRQPSGRLADPLHLAGRGRHSGLAVDQAVLQRRRAGVDDQHVRRHSGVPGACFCAWIAVMAIVLTMSRTPVPRDRSFTGLRRPWRIGPTASAPADRCTAL